MYRFALVTKPLRNVDHLTLGSLSAGLTSLIILFSFGSVVCGINYLLVLESQIPCQSFVKNLMAFHYNKFNVNFP